MSKLCRECAHPLVIHGKFCLLCHYEAVVAPTYAEVAERLRKVEDVVGSLPVKGEVKESPCNHPPGQLTVIAEEIRNGLGVLFNMPTRVHCRNCGIEWKVVA